MKQSNCYLYEYENNRQVRNVGFVKYIQTENKVTFQIHGKGINCVKNEQYEMYIFAGKNQACYVSRAGAVETEQGRINYMITVEGVSEEDFFNYDGIYLQVGGSKKYVAMWNKSAICFDKIESYDFWATENPSFEHYTEEEEHEEESCDQNHIEDNEEEMYHEEILLNDCPCDEAIEPVEEIVDEMLVPCEEDFQEEEVKSSDIIYEKIERQDIAKLPQREWKLANNSFLLHGYHNYEHILFIQEAGRTFIGVPGIYAPREADAAKNFGFPVFHRVGRRDMQWDEGEREYNVDFGYWCREVTYHKR